MIRVSEHQAVVLARLAAGWRLQFRSMVRAWWITPSGSQALGPDVRAVNGLWKRKLIELGGSDPAHPDMDVRYFTLTAAGRDAVARAKGTTP